MYINSAITYINQNTKIQYILLAFITLLAAVLRMYKLGGWSFWIDEIFTINRATIIYGSIESTLLNLPPNINWIPLSTILTAQALNIFGINEWSARLVPTVIGVITIPVLYFPLKKMFGHQVTLISLLLLAVSTWHIEWSQNARFYTSLMLFYFLASLAFFLFIERGHVKYLLLFAVLLFLAMSERLNAMLLIPVLIVYLLLLFLLPWKKPTGYNLRNLILLGLPAVAVVILELYSLATTGTTRLGFAFETFLGNPIDDPIRIFILIMFSIGIPLAVLAFFSGISLIAEKHRLGLFLFLNATIPVGILLAGSPFVFTVERYAFITLPSWILLASYGIWEIARKAQFKPYLISACILFVIVGDMAASNLMYYQINHGNRQDWRHAMQLVTNNASKEDIIVSSVAELGSYYAEREVVWLGDIDPEAVTNYENRYWFVIDSQNGWFSPDQKSWVESNAILIEELYLRVRETMNIRIYLYSHDEQNPLK
jgi:mannosyltransferase